ncbi:cell wall-binding repeat-containing protein [Pseudoclavibacter sp. RFBA6]|uniref:cell wall-binding repeat-containing protein n=1 Tax=Pseudoclavibacter sp. RFBA6 TaxID=2080573 RepID=UPI000CE8650D|nr:cell wall-binding repeat-containing protein [Pseudoclavibacter sp. RFBA6]PPG42721.1 hypothetical protein C5C17_02630 [Pseudoclavibacter sp. RFBA6]
MRKQLSLLLAAAVCAAALTATVPFSAQAAEFGRPGQDVMSPSSYVAKGSYATTDPQDAPVSALSEQTAQFVNTLPDRYLSDQWKGRLKTSTNTENFTIPIYTVDSSLADSNWVGVKMLATAPYKDIHPVLEGKATASATGGTYGFEIAPIAETDANYGRVALPDYAVPGGPNPGGDLSMTVVDTATGIVRGYYQAKKQTDGSWVMGGGYLTTLDNPEDVNWFDENYWLQAERGTSSVGGVMNEFLMAGAEEIAAGSIDHVTSWTFPSTKSGEAMWPAYQSDGKLTEAEAPKMGQRFWLPDDEETNAQIAALGLSEFEKVVVKNLQEYGGIITDQNYWTMALNLQHPVTSTSQGKLNPYKIGGVVHRAYGDVSLINKVPWNLTKWGEISASTNLDQQVPSEPQPTTTPAPTPTATPTTTATPTPTTTPPPAHVPTGPMPTGTATRHNGTNVFITSVSASKTFNTVGKPLIIADGESSVDSLVAAPAAAKLGASVLHTRQNLLPQNVATEIKRLQPPVIYAIGNLTDSVKAQLAALTPSVQSVGGASSTATSAAVAQKFFPSAMGAFVANANSYSEVANAAARSALTQSPVLLTEADTLGQPVIDYITKAPIGTIKVAGTSTSVSDDVFSVLQSSRAHTYRVNASQDFALNSELLLEYSQRKPTIAGFTIANPTSPGDVAVALAVSARSGYPVVFTTTTCIPAAQSVLMGKYPNVKLVTIGETGTVQPQIHTKRCAT